MKKIILTLFLFVCVFASAQPGSINTTFNPTDSGVASGNGANNSVWTATLQQDGKVIIGGFFTTYNGTPINRIARLNLDGTLDTSFNPISGANGLVRTTAVQPDGKIIIGGQFTSYDGATCNKIARLNSDGTIDSSFNIGLGANLAIRTIALQTNGKIIIGGEFTSFDGTARNHIARLNTDGTLDNSFNPTLGANGAVTTAKIQSNGKIIIGGFFTSYNGTTRNRIARLNSDASLDTSFNSTTGANGTIHAATVQHGGKIIIGGSFTSYNGASRNRIARLNADGTLDISFNPNPGANETVYAISVNPNGKIIIGGEFTAYKGSAISRIAVVNTDGSLDNLFDPGLGANGTVLATALQRDGRIIIGGEFTTYKGLGKSRIARIHTVESQIVLNMATPTLTALSSISYCVSAKPYTCSGVKEYRFYIKNNLSGVTREIISSSRFLSIPSDMRNYNASYDIKASAIVDGEVIAYLGNTIRVYTPEVVLTKLAPTSCGATLARLGATISSTAGLNALSYTFRARLTSDNGLFPTYYYTAALPTRFTSMTSFIGLLPQYDASYSVSVSYQFSSVVMPTNIDTPYGEECLVNMPNVLLTELRAPTCGTTLVYKGATISATPAIYAFLYEFRIRLTSDNAVTPMYYYTLPSTTRFSTMSSFQGLSLMYDTTYSISVRYKLIKNGVEMWSDYGSECELTTPQIPVVIQRIAKVPFSAVAYPNPFANSFLLNINSSNNSLVDIKVYDMIGRLVEQKQTNINELETTAIGNNYPSGIYNVVVAQDNETKAVRVVKR